MIAVAGCGGGGVRPSASAGSAALTPEECLDQCRDRFGDDVGACGGLHGQCSSACNPSCAARCAGHRPTCMGRCVSQCTQRCRLHHRECHQHAGEALSECRAACAVPDAGPVPDAPAQDAPAQDAGANQDAFGCGDGVCDVGEDASTCPTDCGCAAASSCAAGIAPAGCACDLCCADQGTCCPDAMSACGVPTSACGNGVCDCGENNASCYTDCACGDGTCQAPEKPYVLFDFDTSGSMAWDTCDPSATGDVDHTVECPGIDVSCTNCNAVGCGDGIYNDGRLWKVKTATTDVVNTHPNATYALTRFQSDPVPFACKGGGWSGPSTACFGAPLGQGDNAADILVEFAPGNETNLLEWMDFEDNYAGVAPSTGCALCSDCGGGCDKELRPTGATPVAGSLFSANEYLDSVRASDPLGGCRPQAVILVTDGANNCSDPANPSDNDPSPEQAAALCADGVPVYVIGFASPSLAGILGEIAAAGCGPSCDQTGCDGLAILVDDETNLAIAMGQIVDAQNINACGENPSTCPADCCDADGVCDTGETACCSADACADSCGDHCCTGSESPTTCPADCGP